jgi:hypothetical protein
VHYTISECTAGSLKNLFAIMSIDITKRFRAIRSDGIGYMYLNAHTEKPIHPIVEQIHNGIARKEKLIPRDNPLDDAFWIPSILQER